MTQQRTSDAERWENIEIACRCRARRSWERERFATIFRAIWVVPSLFAAALGALDFFLGSIGWPFVIGVPAGVVLFACIFVGQSHGDPETAERYARLADWMASRDPNSLADALDRWRRIEEPSRRRTSLISSRWIP